jgi:hypothetical protein
MANRTTTLTDLNLKGAFGSTEGVDRCSPHIVASEVLHARGEIGAIDGRGHDSETNSPILEGNSSFQPLRDDPAPDFVGRLFMRVCLWVEFLSTLRQKY